MIKIDYLKNHLETLPRLVEIWHETLGKWLPGITTEHLIQKYQSHSNINSLPLTLVAFENNQPIGMCSLRENDGIRPDLKPWLGSLIVSPIHQNKGIGKILAKAIIEKTKEMKLNKIYLFTLDSNLNHYYAGQGWVEIGKDIYKKYPVTVMELNL